MTKTAKIITAVAIGFIILWGATIFWEFGQWRDLDERLAAWLNSFVGRSETLDLTVAFLALKSGDSIGILLLAVMAIRLMQKRRQSSLVRVILFGIFIFLVIAIAYVIIDAIDSYITRPSPMRVIPGYVNPGVSLGFEFPIPGRSRFPSHRVAFYTVVGFLCLFRFGSGALPMLLPGLVLGTAAIMAGSLWPSDILGGFFFGWIVVGAVYAWRVNEWYFTAEGLLDEWFRSNAEPWMRRKATSWARRRELPLESVGSSDTHRTPPKQEDLDPQLAHMLDEYWGITSPRLLDHPHKNKLYPIEWEGVRYAFKISRSGVSSPDSLAAAINVVRDLGARGIVSAPAIIPARDGSPFLPMDDRQVYLMQWIDGHPPDPIDIAQLSRVIEMLAILHRETNDPDAAPAPQSLIEQELCLLADQAENLDRRMVGVLTSLYPRNAESREIEPLLAQMLRANAIARLAGVYAAEDQHPRSWCYIHGDTHPMNYRVDQSDRLYLLDIDQIKPGIGMRDLVRPLGKLVRWYNWNWEIFQKVFSVYTQVRPMPRWELVLLLAHLTVPTVARKGSRQRRRLLVPRSDRLKLVTGTLQLSLEERVRALFFEQASAEYRIPLVATVAVTEPRRPDAPAADGQKPG